MRTFALRFVDIGSRKSVNPCVMQSENGSQRWIMTGKVYSESDPADASSSDEPESATAADKGGSPV